MDVGRRRMTATPVRLFHRVGNGTSDEAGHVRPAPKWAPFKPGPHTRRPAAHRKLRVATRRCSRKSRPADGSPMRWRVVSTGYDL